MSTLARLDRLRHKVPFWWWLTYDALVALVIVVGISPSDPAFWLGFATLAIAVLIDAVEFLVKRPSARARLAALATAGELEPAAVPDGACFYSEVQLVAALADIYPYAMSRVAQACDERLDRQGGLLGLVRDEVRERDRSARQGTAAQSLGARA